MIDQTRNAKIRKACGISFIVLTALLGLAFIIQAYVIYLSGGYTEEKVQEGLTKMLLPSLAWAACLIVEIVVYAMCPVEPKKVKGLVSAETSLRKIASRLPEEKRGQLDNLLKPRCVILWSVVAALVALSFVFPVCYLLNPKHFNYTDTNTEMVEAVKHTLPFVAVAFAVVIVGYVLHQTFLSSAIAEAKRMMVEAAKDKTLCKDAQLTVKEGWLDNPVVLWAVRGAIFTVSLFLIIFGIANGGLEQVFAKAAELCMECVGLA